MPKGAVQLMSGTACRNQAFRFGRTSYAFQCHFEVSVDLAKQWFDQWGHTIVERFEEPQGLEVLTRARDGIARHSGGAANFCRVVSQRWAALVREAREGRAA